MKGSHIQGSLHFEGIVGNSEWFGFGDISASQWSHIFSAVEACQHVDASVRF